MKSKIFIMASATVIAALAASCKPQQATVNQAGTVVTETPQQTEVAIEDVLFGSWAAIDVNGQHVEGPDVPYVEFAKDASNPFLVKCYAYDGCNYTNGEYAVTSGGKMKAVSDFAKTMMMCDDAKYELGVTMAINNVTNFKIQKVGLDNLLYMYNAQGQTLMTLRKYDSKFIEGAWKVTMINNTSVEQDADLSLVFDLAEKTVHGNAGCNALNGQIYVDPNQQNSFQFRDIATTRMTCPMIQLEQQFLSALSQVKTIRPTNANTAELLNEAGQAVVTLQREATAK